MLPHQRKKIDISSLTEEEQKLFRLYGKLPSKKDILSNKLKERKYFDSGDYALSKAGRTSDVGVTQIGSKHPLPENIPHSQHTTGSATTTTTPSDTPTSATPGGHSGALVKEGHLQKPKSTSPEPIENSVPAPAAATATAEDTTTTDDTVATAVEGTNEAEAEDPETVTAAAAATAEEAEEASTAEESAPIPVPDDQSRIPIRWRSQS